MMIVLRSAFPFMLAIALAMIAILVPHIKLILAGYTTVEERSCPGERIVRNPYDLGKLKNIQRIFGTNLLGFILPLPLKPGQLSRQPYGKVFKDR